jgi:hypothetical protein
VVGYLKFEVGADIYPETSLSNYQSAPRSIPRTAKLVKLPFFANVRTVLVIL